jgi:protease PrsW
LNHYCLFLISVLPSLLILWYFYRQDKYQKEPIGVIWKIFFLSAVITIPLAILFESIIDIFAVAGILGLFVSSFLSAALVEESLKCWMVKKFAFHKPFFDEVYDGIVYAVTASLGFATLENVMYVMFQGDGAWSVAIMRSITAVPGHAFDGALLGYYLGLAKFAPTKKETSALIRKGLIIAILFHGLYDFFIFSGFLSPFILVLLLIQGRYVSVAIKRAHTTNPGDDLVFGWKDLTAGLKFFDFVNLFFGLGLGLFSILILIGFAIMTAEDGGFLFEAGGPTALAFTFFCLLISYFSLRSVRMRRKKYLMSLKTTQ